MTTMERRATNRAPELRAAGDDGNVAKGYAALFNVEADIGGYFRERILPGAFADALKPGADVLALHSHDTGRVIGRSIAGTLRLAEDTTGLAVEIDLPDTGDGRDLAVQLERGDIRGMSFGFRVTHDEWDESGEIPWRKIHKPGLYGVWAVANPAYGDTSLALRSLDAARNEKRRKNFSEVARRLRAKATLDLVGRGVKLEAIPPKAQ